MKLFMINYSLILIIFKVSSIRLSFIKSNPHNGCLNFYKLGKVEDNNLDRRFILNGLCRTGVCVPEDVGLYGRLMISYECLYTKDGRTQTGDEWEAEMTAETKATFAGKTKKPKKEPKVIKESNEPDGGFKELEIPAPFNPKKMLLREGIPYLTLSCWCPGIKKDDFKVFLNYTMDQKYPDSYLDSSKEIELSPELQEYYQVCENEPFDKPHKFSYHSTYNDLFNRMKKPDYGYADVDDELLKPPVILINFPKNTLVNQWERVTFSSKRDPEKNKKLLRIQRAYRPFSHIDLRDISCIYKEGTLQIRMKLTHVPPPPDFQSNYKLTVSEEGEIRPPKTLPVETVHGWMYNWHFFRKYDLDFDLSKIDTSKIEDVNRPKFVDDMTPRQVRKFIREVDELKKKGLD